MLSIVKDATSQKPGKPAESWQIDISRTFIIRMLNLSLYISTAITTVVKTICLDVSFTI